jgi:hypothetical protein
MLICLAASIVLLLSCVRDLPAIFRISRHKRRALSGGPGLHGAGPCGYLLVLSYRKWYYLGRKGVNMMDRPSLKKDIVSMLSYATDTEELGKNDVVIITAFGIVSGRIPHIADPEDPKESDDSEEPGLLDKITEELVKKYRERHGIGKDEKLPGNDGCLALKDVSIRTAANNTFNLPELIIFYDQIIGIAIGNLE